MKVNLPLVLATLLDGRLNLILIGEFATVDILDSKGYIFTDDFATLVVDAYVVSVLKVAVLLMVIQYLEEE